MFCVLLRAVGVCFCASHGWICVIHVGGAPKLAVFFMCWQVSVACLFLFFFAL